MDLIGLLQKMEVQEVERWQRQIEEAQQWNGRGHSLQFGLPHFFLPYTPSAPRPWVGHSYDEHFFGTYVKEVMTDQHPKGPVVYSLCNGNAHYIGATVDLAVALSSTMPPTLVEPIALQREVHDGDALGM